MTSKKAKTTSTADLYDGNAPQRIPLEITEGSDKFETAHNVGPVTDAMFLEFVGSIDPAIDDAAELQAALETSATSLWRQVVRSVENIEADDDFRELIDFSEIESVIQSLLNVHVERPTDVTPGVRTLSAKATVQVRTRAFLSGRVLTQSHRLVRRTDEHRKKYEQIYSGGDDDAQRQINRAKAKGALYDEIAVSQDGFKGKVPLRFKTVVVDYYFESSISGKK